MPKQNRVTPFGDIVAIPERGGWMGNRGLLHDPQQVIRRSWRLKAWITCKLSFKERQREVMSPGKYTELFFLDEVTAMAAGHRPCAECRREDYRRFKSLWLSANQDMLPKENPRIGEIDAIIHRERIDLQGNKVLFEANIDSLPDGVFIISPTDDKPALIWRQKIHTWTPNGYIGNLPLPNNVIVRVLTPGTLVKTIAAGYQPTVHSTIL